MDNIAAASFEKRCDLVRDVLAKSPGVGTPTIAKLTGIPRTTVRQILQRLTGLQTVYTANREELPPGPVDAKPAVSEETGKRTIDSGKTTRVVTVEELLAVTKTDLTRWRVARPVLNKWDVASKHPETGKVTVTELFQIKVYLEAIPGLREIDALREVIADLKVEAKRAIPIRTVSVGQRNPASIDDPVLLEISPFDLHHGKLAWAQETGVAYDAKISSATFILAVQNLWMRAAPFPVQRVLLVLGQDFFTADNSADTTTAGTPQHVDSRFAKNFRSGWRIMREAIEYLRQRCPGGVDVLIVPGNHDTDTAFCAGEVLCAMYEHTKDVRINNEPSVRKYFRFGTNLLGFTHGDKEKHAQLPLLMAQERRQDWAETTSREIHIGHLHHSKSTSFVSGSEHNAIRVRILPSLSGTDAWHHAHGYTAKRAAEAYLWSFKHGYIGHLSWSPD